MLLYCQPLQLYFLLSEEQVFRCTEGFRHHRVCADPPFSYYGQDSLYISIIDYI